ncbi:MAG: DNA replication and repair protein RecF, partial [Verrucomicrobiia bacterium]
KYLLPYTHQARFDFICSVDKKREAGIVELGSGTTLFVGSNGNGKTSLLEAACVLLRLNSPRTARLGLTIRHGTEEAALAGLVGEHRIDLYLGRHKRRVCLDGIEKADLSECFSLQRVVWFGNTDIQLATGPADLRRRFLDFLGSQAIPGYRRVMAAYDRALRSRNTLLRKGQFAAAEAFNGPLLATGHELTQLRITLVTDLEHHFKMAYHLVSAGEQVQITYKQGATENMARALAESRQRERLLGYTIAGPHRDDLLLNVRGHSVATHGSEGQQRSVAIALKLAQRSLIESANGIAPLLLVDDVFGELDRERRSALLSELSQPDRQALVSTTRPEGIEALQPARIYEVTPRHTLLKHT